jgi:hypothetical protein
MRHDLLLAALNVCIGIFAGFLAYNIYYADEYFFGWARIFYRYLVPAVLLGFGILAAIRHRTPLLKGAVLFFAVLFAALYGIEAWLTAENYLARLEMRGKGDRRPPAAVFAALREQGVEALPFVPLHDFLKPDPPPPASGLPGGGGPVFPLSGPAGRHIVQCHEYGYWLHYPSDARGFNNARDFWAAGKAKIVLLGDSYVLGHCVPPDATVAAAIRARYPDTANLGYSGVGPLIELGILRELVPSLRPEAVVWFHFENDLNDLALEMESPLLRRYLEPGFSQRYLARFPRIDRAVAARAERLLREKRGATMAPPAMPEWLAKLPDLVMLRNAGYFLGFPREPGALPYDAYAEVLARAKRETEAMGARFLFVYLPFTKNYVGLSRYTRPRGYARGRVLAAAKAAGARILDFHDVIARLDDPLSISDTPGGHYNGNGYRLLGEAVADAIAGMQASASR